MPRNRTPIVPLDYSVIAGLALLAAILFLLTFGINLLPI